jgi:hypothetical protein
MLWSWKRITLFSDTAQEEKSSKIKNLIENVRKNINSEDFIQLSSDVEALKAAMKEMVDANPVT